MDTTQMEYTAEDLIAHKLQRAGLLVSKPKFDQEGADLFALMSVKDGAKFCRIQCQGKSLIEHSSSSIRISKNYVSDAFVFFLSVEDGIEENIHLFAFFRNDIEKWKSTKYKFVLPLRKSTLQEDLKYNTFSNSTIEKIKSIISKANMRIELAIIMPQVLQQPHNDQVNENIIDDSKQPDTERKPERGIFEPIIISKRTVPSTVEPPLPDNPEP